MTSNKAYSEAFVWVWLPNETEPVVAGKLEIEGDNLLFNYGKSYLNRINSIPKAISLYEGELPLQLGIFPLLDGLTMPGCIRDAAPDAWGRRVIINKKLGLKGLGVDSSQLDELTYLLESGSDRIGALDFQLSPTQYIPRLSQAVSLEELLESSDRVEKGIPLTPELDQALFHGSSIGGARPKALIEETDKKYIAKFSLSTDLYSVVKTEFIAMRLAKHVGLNVAEVELTKASNKDVLLIERFDRIKANQSSLIEPDSIESGSTKSNLTQSKTGWQRKSMISALTLFGLNDMMARYASYETLAEIIRHKFLSPSATLRELFSRLVFNILCGNTDDHARNHAAFWDGKNLELTPAYDICPQGRAGNEASQAMLIFGDNNLSQLKNCIDTAHNFGLTKKQALELINTQESVIKKYWKVVCEEAELTEVDSKLFWKRQFLNPFSCIKE